MKCIMPSAPSGPCQAYVLYRTPHSTCYHHIRQFSAPLCATTLQALPQTGGYVVMPFRVTAETPIVFIRPDEADCLPLSTCDLPATAAKTLCTDEAECYRLYQKSFEAAHTRLERGELAKVVLSRRLHLKGADFDPHRLFAKACQRRPDCFVALWYTPQTGHWIVATPEPLLERLDTRWHTVALAGTLPYTADTPPQWNEKNRKEQAIVADFVAAQLQGLATDIRQSATYSRRTGNIQHLCTDFSFDLPEPDNVCKLLLRLHPTPAVCGVPREAALAAIAADEDSSRHYYAGFSGPLGLQGETRLFVSLRCMAFDQHMATLYAGGGLMPGSRLADEWEETCRKMQTMMEVL